MPRYNKIFLTKSQRNALRVEPGQTVYVKVGTNPLLHSCLVAMSPYRTSSSEFRFYQDSNRAEVADRYGDRIVVALGSEDTAYSFADVRANISDFQTDVSDSFDPFAERTQEAFDPAADTAWMSGEDEGEDSWYTNVVRSSRAMAQRTL